MSQESKNTLIAEYKTALEAAELARDRARVEERVASQAKERAKHTMLVDDRISVVRVHERSFSVLRSAEAAYLRAKQKYDAACNLK